MGVAVLLRWPFFVISLDCTSGGGAIRSNTVLLLLVCALLLPQAKEKTYDAVNNLACLLPAWVSKASARQRRGRAGRVQVRA
jgi:hypothetical protein